ncbi:MAPEG family protein [Breoghania sp.]|uniref:MAPEG family protein n=1 Tax=Breoghania sp. TaxID=2065378 RepID=UPI002AAA82E6|nr:MAPEG family protein [Breoghania sp.]
MAASLPVTTALVSGLAILFLVLTARVIRLRIRHRVSLGDGGNAELTRAIRGHGNLVESAPLFVLMLLLAELQGANTWLIGVLAGGFLVGRTMHGICLGFMKPTMVLRSGGMLLTLITMIAMTCVDLAIILL